MSDKIKLLPCPFCGGIDIGHSYIETYSCDSSYRVFGCISCGARFEEGDAQNWNRRAAIAQQPAQAVPDGYALVPIKPTYEMTVAYNVRGTDYPKDPLLKGPPRNLDHGAYSAMLAAAPAAPVAQEPVAWMRCDEYPSVTASGAVLEDWRRQRVVIRPLYVAPPAVEQPDTGRELFAELYQILGALGASEAVLDQVLAASQGEPLPHASLLPYAAGQPDTVKVPRELLAEAKSIIDSYAESLKASCAPGGDWNGAEAAQDDYEREAGVASKLRRLLAGGAE